MPESSLPEIALDLKADFIRLSKSSKDKDVKDWIKCYPEMIQPRILERVLNEDWDHLARKAKKEMKARDEKLSQMKAHQKDISEMVTKIRTAEEIVTKNWLPVKKRENWKDDRGRIAAALVEKGFSPERIDRELSKLEELKPDNLFRKLQGPANSSSDRIDKLAGNNLSYSMGNLLLSSVSRFNKAVLSARALKIPAEEALAKVEKDLSGKERSIWSALRANDLSGAKESARTLAAWAAGVLNGDMAGYAAAISKRRKQEPENITYGRLGLKTGDAIRGLLLAVALGKWVDWLAGWGPSAKSAGDWTDAALSIDFPEIKNTAPEVEIFLLAEEPSKYDGAGITIYGTVGAVSIEHRQGKVISSAPVYASDGRSVEIVLPYIKLDSGGLVPGAYARITGTWNAVSKEINKPALQIGRRSLKAEGKENWLAWVEDALRNVIEITPHCLSAGWSWEPGNNGAVNSLRYGTWYYRKGGK